MVRSLVALIVLLCLSGCGAEIPRQYSGAVGYSLHSQSTAKSTSFLNAYVGHICQQAGLPVGYVSDLSYASKGASNPSRTAYCHITSAAQWKEFVQMGVYDIDRRCDAFLENIYYKDKTREPTVRQINDVRNFTVALLEIVSPGSAAISIVSSALGLGQNTFQNIRGGLLEALDQTTVKSLVYGRQKVMKQEIEKTQFSNRPQALNALRAYLRLCMPHTIEMEANAVLTTFQRTGTAGNPVITITEPLTADKKPVRRGTDGIVGSSAGRELFGANSPFGDDDVKTAQGNLCTSADGAVGDETRAALYVYRENIKRGLSTETGKRTPLTTKEATDLMTTTTGCDTSLFVNRFELDTFSESNKLDQVKVDEIAEKVNVVVDGLNLGPQFRMKGAVSSKKNSDFRKSIAAVRQKLSVDEVIPAHHYTRLLDKVITEKATKLASKKTSYDESEGSGSSNGDKDTGSDTDSNGSDAKEDKNDG